jgi:hypothetical protein
MACVTIRLRWKDESLDTHCCVLEANSMVVPVRQVGVCVGRG